MNAREMLCRLLGMSSDSALGKFTSVERAGAFVQFSYTMATASVSYDVWLAQGGFRIKDNAAGHQPAAVLTLRERLTFQRVVRSIRCRVRRRLTKILDSAPRSRPLVFRPIWPRVT